jgi:hypothetical protein
MDRAVEQSVSPTATEAGSGLPRSANYCRLLVLGKPNTRTLICTFIDTTRPSAPQFVELLKSTARWRVTCFCSFSDEGWNGAINMSLITGLGAMAYPLTSLVGAVSSTIAKGSVSNVFQNLLQGQGGTQASSQSSALSPSTATDKKSSAAEFNDYMAMSPAEKMRYSIMNDLGVTQEQLDAMPPEQRAAVEKKIADLMKLREDLQNANNAGGGQQSQTAMNLSLLKQVQAGQKPQASIDIFS